jgi:murein DD-endopeptidase MepM/ murein hydrolase activator NlpD
MGTGGTSPAGGLEASKGAKDENKMVYQMRTDIERLRSESMFREESLNELEKLLQNKQEMLVHTPSVWPAQGWVTSGLGFRTNPFTGLIQFHEGLDIANQTGTLVVSSAHGIVSDIGNDWAYGKAVVISHGFGITTRYAHLNKVYVKVGQRVKRGEKIAEIGTSGRTTGPHLHYEVRVNGIPANPMRYILN